MKNKNRKIAHAILLAGIILIPVAAMAASALQQPPEGKTFDQIISFIKGLIYTIGIALVVIMLLISGIMFITSAGDPEKVQRARNTLLYAVVGAVVLIVAASIFKVIEGWIGTSTTTS
ncbi:MAG: TrbC/VirB2 family protein [Candidatus Staskawiczbacteria bacterium]|nr:TrbC/VirB2 family protein [Candidatus Staskawiczbacteria bacterium]